MMDLEDIILSEMSVMVFLGGSLVKKIHLPMQEMQKTQVRSLGQEDPLEEKMSTHSSIRAWKIMDRGAWRATVHRVPKSRTQLSA